MVWTSIPVPGTSSLRGLDVSFIPLSANRYTASIKTQSRKTNELNAINCRANCFDPKIYCIEFAVRKKNFEGKL